MSAKHLEQLLYAWNRRLPRATFKEQVKFIDDEYNGNTRGSQNFLQASVESSEAIALVFLYTSWKLSLEPIVQAFEQSICYRRYGSLEETPGIKPYHPN